MSTPIPNPVLAITTLLQDSGVVPDVIPAALGFRPSIFFSPVYPKSDGNAVLGTSLSKDHTQDEPAIRIVRSEDDVIDKAGKEKSYTLVLTDPDAPSRKDPKFAQWRHWVVCFSHFETNVRPGCDITLTCNVVLQITGLRVPNEPGSGMIQKTKPSSTPYYGPAPPPGTGPHRYGELLRTRQLSDLSALTYI